MRDIPRTWWLASGCFLVALAMLPILRATLQKPASADRCCLDGLPIKPAYRVRTVCAGQSSCFCSLACAESWLNAQRRPPTAIFVTDETTGREIDVHDAVFVQSQVVVHAGTLDRRHTFLNTADAAEHAAAHRGRVLLGERRPFATLNLKHESSRTLLNPVWH